MSKDRMRKDLGSKTAILYRCKSCRAVSSKRKCPDPDCNGTMELVEKKSQF